MKLNELGRNRVRTMALLGFFGVVISVFLLATLPLNDASIAYLLPAVSPFLYYSILASKFIKRIRQEMLSRLGFMQTESLTMHGIYKIADISKFTVNETYSGSIDSHRFNLVQFMVERGSGKNKVTYNFVGAEFETSAIHRNVQIYDVKNFLKPFFGSRKLESDDFHRHFSVHSANTKDAFYQLDPDTMSDLMHIRKELDMQINIESSGNKILIYIPKHNFDKKFLQTVTIKSILNDEIDEEKIEIYRQDFANALRSVVKVFKTLDYKLSVAEELA